MMQLKRTSKQVTVAEDESRLLLQFFWGITK